MKLAKRLSPAAFSGYLTLKERVMKRSLVALVLLTLSICPQLLVAAEDYYSHDWVAGHLMLNFKETTGTLYDIENASQTVHMGIPSVDALFAQYKVSAMYRVVNDQILAMLKTPPDFLRYMLVICPPETDIEKMVEAFSKDPNVELAQPDYAARVMETIPNDPLWGSQWDRRLMNLPVMWDFSTGSNDLIMAAVDIGTWWRHNDLHDNLWLNPREDLNHNGLVYSDTSYPGDIFDRDSLDNDSDGYVDDLMGWDFIRNMPNCEPGEDCDSRMDNDPTSLEDHGTHVAGIMGAVGNNNLGVAGVNWHCKMIANRAGYKDRTQGGLCPNSAANPAILWVAAMGAKVINMSFGGPGNDPNQQAAINSAWNQGAILVGSAGNDGRTARNYPGADNNVVCVGSVDPDDRVSDFSNRGTWVDIFAPGAELMSLTFANAYVEYQGTSMSSPNMAGVFGLTWTLFPTKTNAEIIDLVYSNTVDITALNPTIEPESLGHGRVDAELILKSAYPHIALEHFALSGDNDGDLRLESGETANLVISLHNDENWQTGDDVVATVTTSDPMISVSDGVLPLGLFEPGVTMTNTTNPIHLTAGTFTDAHWATINVRLTSAAVGYTQNHSFQLRIGRPQTLLVADDNATGMRHFFSDALLDTSATVRYNYDLWDVAVSGDPAWTDVAPYNYIFWVCGDEGNNTINTANQAVLTQFLTNGGKLLVDGQNINEDISTTSFYADYLHAQSGSGTGGSLLTGLTGDPISGGTTLRLLGAECSGTGATSPSVIVPANGGIGIYTYGSTANVGAVRYENGTYKVVYFAFSLEAACGAMGSVHYSNIIRNIMQWFGATPAAGVEPARLGVTPSGYALRANYPNPFNPVTTLAFDLPRASEVSLVVFDMLGRQVAELVNGRMNSGTHYVSFDGSSLSSGTYFARIKADGFTASQRMTLLK
jgi:hypothetical protein